MSKLINDIKKIQNKTKSLSWGSSNLYSGPDIEEDVFIVNNKQTNQTHEFLLRHNKNAEPDSYAYFLYDVSDASTRELLDKCCYEKEVCLMFIKHLKHATLDKRR